jgi:hypothetical protein
MAELALDDVQWHTLPSHLDGVRMAQLMSDSMFDRAACRVAPKIGFASASLSPMRG